MDRILEVFSQNPSLERLLHPDVEELHGLSESVRQLRTAHQRNPDCEETAFQLAGSLISHSRQSYVEEGVRLMESLLFSRWKERWEHAASARRQGAYPATGIVRGLKVVGATAPPPSESDEDARQRIDGESGHYTDSSAMNTGYHSFHEVSEGLDCTSHTSSSVSLQGAVAMAGTAKSEEVLAHEEQPDAGKPDHRPPTKVDDLAMYHYYLTIGWVKLGDFDKALSCVNQMLLASPHNKQGMALQEYIDIEARRGAVMSSAVVAGTGVLLAGAVVALGALIHGKR